MAWSMPNSGQWNPGIAMTPDMNMGSFTPDQWALMQQQNWQQWTQWQQQYAHWQSQYGDEYSQQMMRMQGMGGMPPTQSGAVPPPVPPPEKPPPPPPPHENDEPLYRSANVQASPAAISVKTQQNKQAGNNHGNNNTGNNQNWSYTADSYTEKQSTQGVNTEALKKLAEEEKLFDIQFQKWEAEIEKWKSENVNHPDRQAYREYEQKFEACRAQLLERRLQMKAKRADLMGNAPSATEPTNTGNNISIDTSLNKNNHNLKLQQNAPFNVQANALINMHSNVLSNPQLNVHSNMQASVQSNVQPNIQNRKASVQRYPNKNSSQYQQYNNATHQNYNRNDNNFVDPQYDNYQDYHDDYTSAPPNYNEDYRSAPPDFKDDYRSAPPDFNDDYTSAPPDFNDDYRSAPPDFNDDYRSAPPDFNDDYRSPPPNVNDTHRSTPIVNSTFLPTSTASKDIPGLDLVPQPEDKSSKQVIIDITEDQLTKKPPHQNTAPPDYSKISKGINNILGDEKIMNILSMMSNQKSLTSMGNNQTGNSEQDTNSMNSQWNTNNTGYYNNDSGNQRQNMPNRQQNVYPNSQEQIRNSNLSDQQYQRYDGNYVDNSQNRHMNVQQEKFCDRQNQYDNKNVQFRELPPSFKPNMPPPRPLLQNTHNLPPQQNSNPGYEQREMMQNFKPNIEPVKPKWIDEPLFTPSIIVEYEHKPLRLKARDFIEPVHTFDYNHKSKDGETNTKKNFEREVDELFTRKPRNAGAYDDWSSERLYSRDYERRSIRDDFKDRSKQTMRADHDMYDRKAEDRRFDDRDRLRRQDYERRDRPIDSERMRDSGYGRDRELHKDKDMGRERDFDRERDIGRDMDRERDFGRERDVRRDRDLGRDRDFGRDREIARDRDMGRDRDIGRERDAGRGRDFGRDRDLVRDRDYGRDRNFVRDPNRDRKDNTWNRSRSRDRDSRKREHSRENDSNDSFISKKSKENVSARTEKPTHIVMIDDLLEPPGRDMRPEKIVIILRGPPGSGKSYLAKLIRDKEAEHGITARIMSIDDYFMQESEIEEKDPNTGKIVKKPSLKYEFDEKLEEDYGSSLKRAFKRSLTDGYFSFLIYDDINDQLKSYADIWNFSRQSGFQVYICTMDLDAQACYKRNIHNRSLEEIEVITSRFFPTPAHHIQLDATTLLQSASIREVQMEDAEDVTMEDADVVEVDSSFTSKWEKMDDAAQLARLDGISKPLRPSQLSMQDYLQLDDWKPNVAKPGKKTVRWADLEERRQQEKMRAIGFVVGQTDWNRMTDPTMGSSALTQTKYIERIRRS